MTTRKCSLVKVFTLLCFSIVGMILKVCRLSIITGGLFLSCLVHYSVLAAHCQCCSCNFYSFTKFSIFPLFLIHKLHLMMRKVFLQGLLRAITVTVFCHRDTGFECFCKALRKESLTALCLYLKIGLHSL